MAQSGAMAYAHTNRHGVTFYLHTGRSAFNEPYEFLEGVGKGALDAIPVGYEVYENPNGRARLVLESDDLVTEAEVEAVRSALQSTPYADYLVEVVDDDIVIMQPDWSRTELARFLGRPAAALTPEDIEDNTHYAPIMCLEPDVVLDGHFILTRMQFDPFPGWSDPLMQGPLDEILTQLGHHLRDAVSSDD